MTQRFLRLCVKISIINVTSDSYWGNNEKNYSLLEKNIKIVIKNIDIIEYFLYINKQEKDLITELSKDDLKKAGIIK